MFITAQEISLGRYNAIIAGSGPAGAVVAKQMAARGKTVLVVESGGNAFNSNVQAGYAVVQGQGHFSSDHWPNHWIRALGGTSAVWAGWVAPLSARNMKSWPISHRDLAPWYDVAAAELGRSPVVSTWSMPALPGFLMRPFSRGNPNRYGEDAGADSGREAGKAIWESDRVHVLLNASLLRLHPRQDRRGIEKITLFTGSAENLTFDVASTQQVVLAAGGMGNAQILFASDDGHGSAVGNESDQVGRYLMEHPHMFDFGNIVVREEFALPNPPAEFGEFTPALVPDDATHAALGPLDASFELYQTQLGEDDPIGSFVINRLGGRAKVFGLIARTEMAADPENRVERIHGTDPAGLPRLRATCVFNAEDYRSVLGYLRHLGDSLSSNNMGRIQIRNQALFFDILGGGHIVGTTRMGNDPAISVTDQNCRVHGYQNLFIAGSSLFPTGGYANPTLTIVALAARLGDYIGSEV